MEELSMEKKMNCHVISIWHNGSYVMDKQHLIVTDYCPIVYSCGDGLYTIKGYFGTKADDYCSIIIDSSFTVMNGSHPMDSDALICDAMKDIISKVISKTLAIIQMEVGSKLNIIIDDIKLSDSIPNQLIEINNWIMKKIIIDYDGMMNNGEYDPSKYFTNAEMSDVTVFVSTWDKFSNIGTAILDTLYLSMDNIMGNANARPYIEDIANNCETIIEKLQLFRTRLDDISK